MSLSQTEKNVLIRFLKTLTDGAVRQLSGREFQSLDAATEKRRAVMSMLCGERKEDFVMMIVTNTTDYMGGSDEQGSRQVDDEKLPNKIPEILKVILVLVFRIWSCLHHWSTLLRSE